MTSVGGSVGGNHGSGRFHQRLSRTPAFSGGRISANGAISESESATNTNESRMFATLDDETFWGPNGELPASSPQAPYHPPLVRLVAATAGGSSSTGETRRRGILQRSISVGHSHTESSHVIHHHHHVHHHYHYYTISPRLAWEYPQVIQRGMPALEQERGDWEVSTTTSNSQIHSNRSRRRRRLSSILRWLNWRRNSNFSNDDDGFDFSYEELIELDARNVSRGLTNDELENLDFHLADDSHDDCHICLDKVHVNDRIVTLKCGHSYHQQCIHTWLKLKRTCPICRCEL